MSTATEAKPRAAVPVSLAERSYEVLIGPGLLPSAARLIATKVEARRCGIVTDDNVAARHLNVLEASLAANDLHAGTIVLAPGEATKSLENLGLVSDHLIEMGLERGDLVIALGGGVIGDL